MFSCKQYYKYINILHISKLTALRNTKKNIFKLSKFRSFKHICFQRYKEFCIIGTYV